MSLEEGRDERTLDCDAESMRPDVVKDSRHQAAADAPALDRLVDFRVEQDPPTTHPPVLDKSDQVGADPRFVALPVGFVDDPEAIVAGRTHAGSKPS